MAITKQQMERLVALHQEVEGRKEYESAAPTYRDTPALQEIEQLVALIDEDSVDSLADKIAITSYLADAYDKMFRIAISCRFYNALMALHAKLNALDPYGEKRKEAFYWELFNALRARNMYAEDPCTDYLSLLSDSFGKEQAEQWLAKAQKGASPHLKHDPVELTDAYLAVIDGCEEYVEKHMDFEGLGACFREWELKSEYLQQHGITWRSLGEMNPGTRFD